MNKIMFFLKGKKTYIVAGAIAVVTFCFQLGYIDPQTATILYGLLGATGMATLRAGIGN